MDSESLHKTIDSRGYKDLNDKSKSISVGSLFTKAGIEIKAFFKHLTGRPKDEKETYIARQLMEKIKNANTDEEKDSVASLLTRYKGPMITKVISQMGGTGFALGKADVFLRTFLKLAAQEGDKPKEHKPEYTRSTEDVATVITGLFQTTSPKESHSTKSSAPQLSGEPSEIPIPPKPVQPQTEPSPTNVPRPSPGAPSSLPEKQGLKEKPSEPQISSTVEDKNPPDKLQQLRALLQSEEEILNNAQGSWDSNPSFWNENSSERQKFLHDLISNRKISNDKLYDFFLKNDIRSTEAVRFPTNLLEEFGRTSIIDKLELHYIVEDAQAGWTANAEDLNMRRTILKNLIGNKKINNDTLYKFFCDNGIHRKDYTLFTEEVAMQFVLGGRGKMVTFFNKVEPRGVLEEMQEAWDAYPTEEIFDPVIGVSGGVSTRRAAVLNTLIKTKTISNKQLNDFFTKNNVLDEDSVGFDYLLALHDRCTAQECLEIAEKILKENVDEDKWNPITRDFESLYTRQSNILKPLITNKDITNEQLYTFFRTNNIHVDNEELFLRAGGARYTPLGAEFARSGRGDLIEFFKKFEPVEDTLKNAQSEWNKSFKDVDDQERHHEQILRRLINNDKITDEQLYAFLQEHAINKDSDWFVTEQKETRFERLFAHKRGNVTAFFKKFEPPT